MMSRIKLFFLIGFLVFSAVAVNSTEPALVSRVEPALVSRVEPALVSHVEPLKVITSTTTFASLVQEVGGEKVSVEAIALPKFNIHFIQPKPSDVRRVRKAELFVFAGLDLELWVDSLLEAAGKPRLFRGGERNLDLSSGIELHHVPSSTSRSEGDVHIYGNPHFHMSPENGKIMANSIFQKLSSVDPANADYYKARYEDFIKRLDLKLAEWKELAAALSGKEIISYHDDIEYLSAFLGLKAQQFFEAKPGIPASPRHLQFLENYVISNKIRGIAMPSYYPQSDVRALAERTGAKVLLIAQNVGELEKNQDLLGFYESNIKKISEALLHE
jgi:zinc/manganese transport system substrate-binding protein